MRVTGGLAKGIPLIVGNSDLVRPATDRMREAVFSSLGHLVDGADCIDLFAGTGSYGLEALSRGASSCLFVEKDGRTVQALQKNLAAVAKSLAQRSVVVASQVRTADVWTLEKDRGFQAQLVFADPPYAMLPGIALRLMDLVDALTATTENVRMVLEMPGGFEQAHPRWQLLRRLGKGAHDPSVGIFQRSPSLTDPA